MKLHRWLSENCVVCFVNNFLGSSIDLVYIYNFLTACSCSSLSGFRLVIGRVGSGLVHPISVYLDPLVVRNIGPSAF